MKYFKQNHIIMQHNCMPLMAVVLSFRGEESTKSSSLFLWSGSWGGRGAWLGWRVFRMFKIHRRSQGASSIVVRSTTRGLCTDYGRHCRSGGIHFRPINVQQVGATFRWFVLGKLFASLTSLAEWRSTKIWLGSQRVQLLAKKKNCFLTFCQLLCSSTQLHLLM